MRRRRKQGLTAVEMTLVISVVGVLLAVFVPTFLRQVRLSKVSEPTLELAEIDARVVSYYERVTGGKRRCLPAPAGPTPLQASPDPVDIDFADPKWDGHMTWKAIGYQPSGPIRYRYSFSPVAATCGIQGSHLWTLIAEGDLDGDGKHSRFERSSGVSEDGPVRATGVFQILDRIE